MNKQRNVGMTPRKPYRPSVYQLEIDAMLDRFNRRFDATIERAERLDQAGAVDLEVERNKRRRPHAGK